MTEGTDEQFVLAAQRLFQDEGTIEVDDGATVSRNAAPNSDHGAYVQAWVWVDNDDVGEDKV